MSIDREALDEFVETMVCTMKECDRLGLAEEKWGNEKIELTAKIKKLEIENQEYIDKIKKLEKENIELKKN